MGLEIIAQREGERIASRIKVNGKRAAFVRGDIDRKIRSMQLIVETHSFRMRRRYEVGVQGERFDGGGFVEVLGLYYPGHLIFGSMDA